MLKGYTSARKYNPVALDTVYDKCWMTLSWIMNYLIANN